jgi:hypothetical protein
MAEMCFQICNLIDRIKENKCKNKTANKEKGRASSHHFTPRWMNSLLSLYKRITTWKTIEEHKKPYNKVDQYINLPLIFKFDTQGSPMPSSYPSSNLQTLLSLHNPPISKFQMKWRETPLYIEWVKSIIQ